MLLEKIKKGKWRIQRKELMVIENYLYTLNLKQKNFNVLQAEFKNIYGPMILVYIFSPLLFFSGGHIWLCSSITLDSVLKDQS